MIISFIHQVPLAWSVRVNIVYDETRPEFKKLDNSPRVHWNDQAGWKEENLRIRPFETWVCHHCPPIPFVSLSSETKWDKSLLPRTIRWKNKSSGSVSKPGGRVLVRRRLLAHPWPRGLLGRPRGACLPSPDRVSASKLQKEINQNRNKTFI